MVIRCLCPSVIAPGVSVEPGQLSPSDPYSRRNRSRSSANHSVTTGPFQTNRGAGWRLISALNAERISASRSNGDPMRGPSMPALSMNQVGSILKYITSGISSSGQRRRGLMSLMVPEFTRAFSTRSVSCDITLKSGTQVGFTWRESSWSRECSFTAFSRRDPPHFCRLTPR